MAACRAQARTNVSRTGRPDLSEIAFWEAAQELSQPGCVVPDGFGHSYLAPLPKAEAPRPGEEDSASAWPAGVTRPLQLGNCDAKLVALLANTVLSKLADKVCLPRQRGFLQSRQIADNLADVDTFARAFGAQSGHDIAAV